MFIFLSFTMIWRCNHCHSHKPVLEHIHSSILVKKIAYSILSSVYLTSKEFQRVAMVSRFFHNVSREVNFLFSIPHRNWLLKGVIFKFMYLQHVNRFRRVCINSMNKYSPAGYRSLSITWMTPLVAMRSGSLDFSSLTRRVSFTW